MKIGYQAGIKLLRAGARSSSPPGSPATRRSGTAGRPTSTTGAIGSRSTGSTCGTRRAWRRCATTCSTTHPRLDYIVNNACQTVRRPPAFYEHMLELESGRAGPAPGRGPRTCSAGVDGVRAPELLGERAPARLDRVASSAELSQLVLLPEDAETPSHLFPTGALDQDLQQVDLRDRNSWRLTLSEVSSVELLETQLVNAVAPFVLNARLKPLMLRTPERDKHIVNVSAVEGQFYRRFKTTRHPHTNMAKAALNMMTRTSAAEYHADGIHMNSVDTGWVSDEDPVAIAEQKRAEHRFHPPLDIVDGAARIVDPIIAGANTGTTCGASS